MISIPSIARRALGAVSVAAVLAIGIGVFHAPAAPPPAPLPAAAIDILAENFLRIALRPDGGPPSRWEVPVRILVAGSHPEVIGPMVQAAARAFGQISGVGASLVNAPEDGFNLVVRSLSRADYSRLVERMDGGGGLDGRYLEEHLVCYSATLTRTGDTELLRANIAIPDDLPLADAEQCVWHEMLHVFGIVGHPDARIDSALRNAQRPTEADLLLLRALYDSRLQTPPPGDPLPAVRAVMQDLLAQLRAPQPATAPAAPARP